MVHRTYIFMIKDKFPLNIPTVFSISLRKSVYFCLLSYTEEINSHFVMI